MERSNGTHCRLLALLISATLALAGCGGGRGGGSGGGGITVAGTPVITQQPSAQNVAIFGTATFTVAVTGNGTLSYQWFNVPTGPYEPIAISGATSASLTVSDVTYTDTSAYLGDYYCVVTNSLNGTTATATSKTAALMLLQRISASLTGESAVLPGSTGHVVSAGAQAGGTYTWTIANGNITAGQGSNQITYTAGPLGRTTITVTVVATSGIAVAIKNVPVVASLPIVNVFAQSILLPGSSGSMASAPQGAGQTYDWMLTSGTASAMITGGQTSDVLTYSVGAATGKYQLSLSLTDALGHQGSETQTLNVVENTFVPDSRDPGPRTLQTATLLNDGRVLVVGGDEGVLNMSTSTPTAGWQSVITATAELFDPAMQSWTAGPSLSTARALHTATLLSDGRVLVAGGFNALGAVGTAEIYDPVVNTWASAATMHMARVLHSATLLPNGQVLVAGGRIVERGALRSDSQHVDLNRVDADDGE